MRVLEQDPVTLRPFNVMEWVKNNQDKLKPPMAAFPLWMHSKDFTGLAVGGPNKGRCDFHVNETEEIYYQLVGEIDIVTIENGKRVHNRVGPGEMYLLPADVPHSPQRPEGAIGLVIEHTPVGKTQKFEWHCDSCDAMVFDGSAVIEDNQTMYHLYNRLFDRYRSDATLRTCAACGHVNKVDLSVGLA
jgi:3-hydroxyanthranilate 3,4-dioxygenase